MPRADRRASLTALTLAALLSGCAIPASPPAVAPKPAAALGLTGAPAPLLDARWWTRFGDPQLDRIVDDALAGNPGLEAALARIAQADAALAGQHANNGPNVTLDAQEQGARLPSAYIIPPPYGGTVRAVGSAEANLAWNLDFFGKQKAAITEARSTARAARLDLTAARLALAGSIAQTYVDLARAEAQAAIAQRTIATRQGSLDLVRVRIRNQLATQIDAAAATTLLAQAREALARAQGARALAANALAALAGHGPDYAAAIQPATLHLDAALPLPATVPADLLARRPDVAAALARIDAAAAGRQVARRAFYPNIDLLAFAGSQAIGLGQLFTGGALTAGIGPAVHLPIFDNGRLKAELSGATAGLDLATASYNDQVVTAVRQAADAIALARALDAQRAQQRDVVRGYAETGRLNAIRVSTGLDSRLDLVDNDVRLLDAELAQVNLAADAARQRVALAVAMGGGFSPEDDK